MIVVVVYFTHPRARPRIVASLFLDENLRAPPQIAVPRTYLWQHAPANGRSSLTRSAASSRRRLTGAIDPWAWVVGFTIGAVLTYIYLMFA